MRPWLIFNRRSSWSTSRVCLLFVCSAISYLVAMDPVKITSAVATLCIGVVSALVGDVVVGKFAATPTLSPKVDPDGN